MGKWGFGENDPWFSFRILSASSPFKIGHWMLNVGYSKPEAARVGSALRGAFYNRRLRKKGPPIADWHSGRRRPLSIADQRSAVPKASWSSRGITPPTSGGAANTSGAQVRAQSRASTGTSPTLYTQILLDNTRTFRVDLPRGGALTSIHILLSHFGPKVRANISPVRTQEPRKRNLRPGWVSV